MNIPGAEDAVTVGTVIGMSRKHKAFSFRLSGTVMLFFMCAFLLLAFRNGQTDMFCLILAVAVPAAIFLGSRLLPKLFPIDDILFTLTNFLCGLGILTLYITRPAYAVSQLVSYAVGLAAMIFTIIAVRTIKVRSWHLPVLLLIPLSLVLLSLPVLSGSEINGAKNWLIWGSFHFQPSELVKITALVIISYYMSKHRFLPWLLFSLLCLGLLMLQKDLGTALVYYGTILLLYWVSSGSLFGTGLGIAGGVFAAILGYNMFAHVRVRVAVWRNPWIDYDNTGYQLVQSLIAIASGGFSGVGLGQGDPTVIPVYESDFIFSVICEQFGGIFGLCVLLIYVAIIWRGVSVAMSARSGFHGLLAIGATAMIALQTFVIVGGVIKMIPLTGVTMPFISYGGSSMVSAMCLSGLIQGVSGLNRDALDEDTRIAMRDDLD